MLKENNQNEQNKKSNKNQNQIINKENDNVINKNKDKNKNKNKENKEKNEIDKLKDLLLEDNITNNNSNKENKNNDQLNIGGNILNNNPKINSNFYNQLNNNQNLSNNNNNADIRFLETKILNNIKDNDKYRIKSNINYPNNQIKENENENKNKNIDIDKNINLNKSPNSLAKDDTIFYHVFINNDGQKYIPDSDTQIVYDEGKHKFVLPEEILKEDDYLKILRIKALLDSMDFSTLNYKEKFEIIDPPFIKGLDKWVNDMKKKENNSDKISTKIIKHEYENSYSRATKPKTSINTKIKNPPNFRIWD